MAIDNPVLPSYILNTPDPSTSLRENLSMGLQVAQAQQMNQLHALQVNKLATDQANQQAFYGKMAEVAKNPSSESIMDLMGMPGALPHIKELKDRFDALSEKEKFSKTVAFNNAYNALDQGKADEAQKVFSDAAEAAKNSGLAQDAKMYSHFAEGIAKNPDGSKMNIGMTLNALDPKFAENYVKMKGAKDVLTEGAAKARKAVTDADLEGPKLRSEINQANAAAGASTAEAGYKGEQTSQLRAAGPSNLTVAQQAAETAKQTTRKTTAEANEADAQQKAKTIQEQSKAFNDNLETTVKKGMLQAGLTTAQANAALDKIRQAHGEAMATAAQTTAQAGAIQAKEQARIAPEMTDQQVEKAKLKNAALRRTASSLTGPVQEKVGAAVDEGTSMIRAEEQVRKLKDAYMDQATGLGAAGLPGQALAWARSKAGMEGSLDQLHFLYKQLTSDKMLQNASSHGAAAIIQLRKMNFPGPTAGRQLIGPLLETMANTYHTLGDEANTKADFLSQNNGDPDIARQSFVANGRIVEPHQRFRDVINRQEPKGLQEARQLWKNPKRPDDRKLLGDRYSKLGWSVSGG